MNTPAHGRIYNWVPDPTSLLGGRVVATIALLPHLETAGNEGRRQLCGCYVRVRNAGETNEPVPGRTDTLIVPIGNAQPNPEGNFLFEPGRGGGRLDKVPATVTDSIAEWLESGIPFSEREFRWRYIQASHFGEVNSYFHLDRIASYVHDLLRELDAPPLPRVTAVVNAHHAVTERDGIRDGLRRGDRWLPFQGGHYRLPSQRHDLAEHEPISPDGEIHLGTGRNLVQYGALVEAAGGPYRANASHNAGILYHEYGHHITRHTVDFRANNLRRPDRQNNRKVALDEGTCDYWAATMLGTPHIWAWHLRHDDRVTHPRSLCSPKTMADFDLGPTADAHSNGTIWGAALWDLRTRLGKIEMEGVRRTDLLILKALLLLGRMPKDEGDTTIQSIRRIRKSYAEGLSALLQADEILNARRHREAILETFFQRGIQPAMVPSMKEVHREELAEPDSRAEAPNGIMQYLGSATVDGTDGEW